MVQDYTNMSVQDKLKLADERLEKLKGTDKYDAFKERVDAMHAKYEPEITKLGQNLEKAGYSRDIANDATWDYKNNRMGLGPAAADRIRHEKDTFTTKRGWKNLGLGFVGALRDVGNSMTFGAIENGDRTREKMMAAKGGEAPDLTGMSNFLATDKVPDTIFGIPVVSRREDYTEADLAFFRDHPEAGGYYDMGEGTPEDGSEEGAPVQDDMPVKGPYPGTLNNPGNVRPGEVVYDGESGTSTARDGSLFLKFKTPQAGLDAMAQSVGQMIRVKIPKAYAKGEIPDARFNVENLVKVYAPSKDKNDVEDYIKFVSGKLGVDRKKELRTDDVKTMASMLEAMIRRDSGHPNADWFENGNYMMAAKRMTVPATKPRKKGAK